MLLLYTFATQQSQPHPRHARLALFAVGVRFELTRVLPLMVFKTISLNRSDTPPNFKVFLPSGDPPQGDKTGALNHYAKPP